MATRSLFRRTHDLTVVRTFRLDSATLLQPGDKLPDRVRLFHRISLYNRRLVGKSDDAWTLALLAVPGEKLEADQAADDADSESSDEGEPEAK